ncbi:hypothetical protein GGS23DRAFT_616568 [Durotheca rogersii]|uniref:uncharacterized protein n=1 Tax=Durotheca rogersii TaxID=419775 RepID=UPI002220DEA5|nr:uncharacterized protein GGS23DRAFT_616568 [Durotheca rogersii]KAI5858223.1 hypothetical protein GGS23DRAFT_616568 [Durotheca rogersii]
MAATSLINPAPVYHPHKPPFPPAYHQPPSAMPGMISPGESRRTSNESEPSQRQSLPSISEVFSGAKPSHYSPTTPTALAGSHSLPHPFSSSAPPRSEPPPEPRPAPPSHEDKFFRYPPRPDVGPPPGPPNSVYAFPEQRDPTKPLEAAPNSGHANPPPQIPYPPGQYPLPPAPISPHHLGPSLPPYDQPRPPLHSDEDYGMHRSRFDNTALNQHFESWGYQDTLRKLSWTSRTICNFAEAYGKIAMEQHGGQPIPERLPSESEVSSMLGNVEYAKHALENLRELVQRSIATEKAREGGRAKGPYDGDDDISMYGEGMNKPYGLAPEIKKRRGRAAPPGRCHSCNRIDTPEWRRGPDGARTLCNACGLHYAKLERKRQMEQRSIRPKTVEERV